MEQAVITFARLTKPIAGANVESARKNKLGVYNGRKGVFVAPDGSAVKFSSCDRQPRTRGVVGAKGRSTKIAGGRNRAVSRHRPEGARCGAASSFPHGVSLHGAGVGPAPSRCHGFVM